MGPGFRRECGYFCLRALRLRGFSLSGSAATTQSSGRFFSGTETAMITADLTGKTALVTGGASGIGLATVEAFARSGATVTLNHLADDPRGAQQVARLKAAGHRIVAAP